MLGAQYFPFALLQLLHHLLDVADDGLHLLLNLVQIGILLEGHGGQILAQLAGGILHTHAQVVNGVSQSPRYAIAQQQARHGADPADAEQPRDDPFYRPAMLLLRFADLVGIEGLQLEAKWNRFAFQNLHAFRNLLFMSRRFSRCPRVPILEIAVKAFFELADELAFIIILVRQAIGLIELLADALVQRVDFFLMIEQQNHQIIQGVLQFTSNLRAGDVVIQTRGGRRLLLIEHDSRQAAQAQQQQADKDRRPGDPQ